MKIVCLQENLKAGLKMVSHAITGRATGPTAHTILMATDGGRLKLTATDLTTSMSVWVGAKVEEEGAIALPARILTDSISSLDEQSLEIQVTPKSKQAFITGKQQVLRFNGMDAKDFPKVLTVTGGQVINVFGGELVAGITQSSFATAKESSRPVLHCVDLKFKGATITLAGADGFRLAIRMIGLDENVGEPFEIILPSDALDKVKKMIVDEGAKVQIAFNAQKTDVCFKTENAELTTSTVSGSFPKYEELIPQKYTSKAVFKRAEFERAINIGGAFGRDNVDPIVRIVDPIVRIVIVKGKMTISGRSEEIGDSESSVDIELEGDEGKIAFNTKYLRDLLPTMRSESISLALTSPSAPGVIREVDDDPTRFTYVVMPMFINWG